ncbi:membrane protein [Spirochaetia bacterium]|nr:membrane protein [Spirochaetia bacterium]
MSTKQKKTIKKAFFCMGIILAAAALVFAPALLAESAPAVQEETVQAAPVKTVLAERQTLQAYLEVNGTIVNSQTVEVLPDMAGKLVSLKVGLGQKVTRGQIIAEVDPSKPGLNYLPSPVRAPISGTVNAVNFAAGASVSPADCIARIAGAAGRLEIEARIPEREVSRLRTGLNAGVFLEAYPGKTFAATISETAPDIDPQSRTKKIVLVFDEADVGPEAGMFVRVRLNTLEYPDVVTVPRKAVVENREGTFVFVVKPGLPETGTVIRRPVETGVTIDGITEITAGLSGGEGVVVQGQQFLIDGSAVRIAGGKI